MCMSEPSDGAFRHISPLSVQKMYARIHIYQVDKLRSQIIFQNDSTRLQLVGVF
jgi:phage terminase Nu1 subunit (DNA packaging protein)